MHEMSLTESVVEIALEETRKAGASRVRRIRLDIGVLSAVEPEAMRFCFAAASAGTAAEGAELTIDSVPGAGWCDDCATTVALDERYRSVSPLRRFSGADDGRRRDEDTRTGGCLMCSVCGCGDAKVEHRHDHQGLADFGAGAARVHVPGLSQERIIKIERGILSKNDRLARDNRRAFAARGVFALNLVSSPGSGKTSLLVKTIEQLRGREEVAVIEGDQQTSNDAERIRAAGAPALQINTGKGCHLDAHMVGHAFEKLESRAGRRAVHRERRQSGLPRRLRSWRGEARRRAVGDRRRRQAAQISGHVRVRRSDADQQERPAALCRFRREQVPGVRKARSIRGCAR